MEMDLFIWWFEALLSLANVSKMLSKEAVLEFVKCKTVGHLGVLLWTEGRLDQEMDGEWLQRLQSCYSGLVCWGEQRAETRGKTLFRSIHVPALTCAHELAERIRLQIHAAELRDPDQRAPSMKETELKPVRHETEKLTSGCDSYVR